jgi:two-component system, NtrC family, sensor kinase
MRAPGTRILLTVIVASSVGAGACLFGAAALALHGAGRSSPEAIAAVGAVAAGFTVWAAATMLVRRVARPVERVLAAASAIPRDQPGRLPLLAEGGLGLDRAALAFERAAVELVEERARLASKVEELTRANRALADARASLIRSEKLATVGRLAAGIAHEVGNPLGAVAGYAEVARARIPPGADPGLADAVDRIAGAAARIDHTVRGLLDFARPGPVELSPVSVPAALEAAIGLARVQPRFCAVRVEVEAPPDVPRVLGRDREMSQVFLNLLLNAADAMEGQGEVRVRVRPDADAVEVEVADSGPGIPPEDLPRVFDPFFTTKPPGAGSGLGLAVTHSLVDSFGGTIEAANEGGKGAVFRLRLRAADGARPGP